MRCNTARERLADLLERSGYTRECASAPDLVRELPGGNFVVLLGSTEGDEDYWVALFHVDSDGSGEWGARPLFQSTDRDLAAEFLMNCNDRPNEPIEVLGELLEWAARLGGFDAPVWTDARECVSAHGGLVL
jgi:hypothetical protein